MLGANRLDQRVVVRVSVDVMVVGVMSGIAQFPGHYGRGKPKPDWFTGGNSRRGADTLENCAV